MHRNTTFPLLRKAGIVDEPYNGACPNCYVRYLNPDEDLKSIKVKRCPECESKIKNMTKAEKSYFIQKELVK
jgi:Zn finger protein HypA/HybF involved in hydrogenase expression